MYLIVLFGLGIFLGWSIDRALLGGGSRGTPSRGRPVVISQDARMYIARSKAGGRQKSLPETVSVNRSLSEPKAKRGADAISQHSESNVRYLKEAGR